jgi:hypothetical protein
MISPGSREQQGFRFRTPTVFGATEEQLADPLSPFASTGLSSDDDIQAVVAQDGSERLDLRRLSDPFPAFEADEAPA